jgi:hypothetical protein
VPIEKPRIITVKQFHTNFHQENDYVDNPRIHRNEIRFRSDNVHRKPLIFFLGDLRRPPKGGFFIASTDLSEWRITVSLPAQAVLLKMLDLEKRAQEAI